MFTGLVEEMGTVLTVGPAGEGFTLSIEGSVTLEGLKFGDSINVNGVCLSVTSFNEREMQFGLAPETLRRTSLSLLQPGSPVNLERAVLPTTRLGGHYVQGHVDGTGTIKDITEEGDALMVTIAAPPDILKYVVPKGYISVDGTSLTIVEVGENWFSLTLIDHSRNLVVLGQKQTGDVVNLEVDIMAKYAEKSLEAWRKK